MFFHRFEIRWDHETGITKGAIALLGERGDRGLRKEQMLERKLIIRDSFQGSSFSCGSPFQIPHLSEQDKDRVASILAQEYPLVSRLEDPG
jgi:hypothetical protein